MPNNGALDIQKKASQHRDAFFFYIVFNTVDNLVSRSIFIFLLL